MNKVDLVGRTTKDIELRQTEQSSLARFTLAVNRRKQGEADFVQCLAWGKSAELLAKYVKRGDRVGICGHIHTGSYKKGDQTIYTTDVVVDDFEFLEPKKAGNEPQTEDPIDAFVAVDDDEQLPF